MGQNILKGTLTDNWFELDVEISGSGLKLLIDMNIGGVVSFIMKTAINQILSVWFSKPCEWQAW